MTETELIESSQQGSTSCFAQLVALYQPRLFSFLLAQCRNREDAEDAIQEAFINAFRHIKTYNSKWKFSTWLFTIARRAAIKKPAAFTESIDEREDIAALERTETVINSNIWVVIKPYLSQESFQVLWFFYAEEVSLNDISVIFSRSVSWVKVSLHRSREKLSKINSVKTLLPETSEENAII
jgi:RNA polymerase sigma-70 factor (ECF subfamily)